MQIQALRSGDDDYCFWAIAVLIVIVHWSRLTPSFPSLDLIPYLSTGINFRET